MSYTPDGNLLGIYYTAKYIRRAYRAASGTLEQGGPLLRVGRFLLRGRRLTATTAADPLDKLGHGTPAAAAAAAATQPPLQLAAKRVGGRYGRRSDAERADRVVGRRHRRREFLLVGRGPPLAAATAQLVAAPPPPLRTSSATGRDLCGRGRHGGRPFSVTTPAARPRPPFPYGCPAF